METVTPDGLINGWTATKIWSNVEITTDVAAITAILTPMVFAKIRSSSTEDS